MERKSKKASRKSQKVPKCFARKLAIIGAGKVGTAIGHILQEQGFDIVAVASRSQESLDRTQGFISGFKTQNAVEAAKRADLILITTNDDQVEGVCQQIARNMGVVPGNVVFHVSGALSTGVLEAAKAEGADIGSIHPLQSFATVEGAIRQLPGSVFGVTAEENIMPLAVEIVEALGGTAVRVRDEDKALYHAAACVASNYFVALVHCAQNIYASLGVSQDIALRALLPLIKGTLANIESQGTAKALTGPIARGDIGPIEEHLTGFAAKIPEKERLYCELGKYTTLVALEKGTISEETQRKFHELLEGGSSD